MIINTAPQLAAYKDIDWTKVVFLTIQLTFSQPLNIKNKKGEYNL